MMELLKNWIVGITCASMILAAVQVLVPDGAFRKIVSFAGGLLLLLVMVTPLLKLEPENLSQIWMEHRMAENGSIDLLKLENKKLVLEIVEEEIAMLISDRVEKMGSECTVKVICSCGENGEVYPESTVIQGSLSENQKTEISKWIESNLAITREKQTFEEGELP